MNRLDNPLYQEDLRALAASGIAWDKLDGATVAISGATGMIGAFLVDALMHKNETGKFRCQVLALGRSEAKARERLPYFGRPSFSFEALDVSQPGHCPQMGADVVLHLASATHPRAYATQPIGAITANVTGLVNLLDYACQSAGARFVFASSVEVYGENRGDVERFDEGYCGYINCNTLRAGYPEAKRVGEALCQAYAAERGIEVFIPRLPRTYGPTILPDDSKALSQFMGKAVAGEDVVLKSEGTQLYSYLYVADVVCALLWILTRGQAGRAYNVCDPASDVVLRDLAGILARLGGGKVVFALPDAVERAGYSTATRAVMDGTRLAELEWRAMYSLEEGLERTVRILRVLGECKALELEGGVKF